MLVLTDRRWYGNIADAIRAHEASSETCLPSEMAGRIRKLHHTGTPMVVAASLDGVPEATATTAYQQAGAALAVASLTGCGEHVVTAIAELR